MPKMRKRTIPLDAGVAAGAECQKSLKICTELPVFGVQYFDTFDDFGKDFLTYSSGNFAGIAVTTLFSEMRPISE
jgi:hypothetical protein